MADQRGYSRRENGRRGVKRREERGGSLEEENWEEAWLQWSDHFMDTNLRKKQDHFDDFLLSLVYM